MFNTRYTVQEVWPSPHGIAACTKLAKFYVRRRLLKAQTICAGIYIRSPPTTAAHLVASSCFGVGRWCSEVARVQTRKVANKLLQPPKKVRTQVYRAVILVILPRTRQTEVVAVAGGCGDCRERGLQFV